MESVIAELAKSKLIAQMLSADEIWRFYAKLMSSPIDETDETDEAQETEEPRGEKNEREPVPEDFSVIVEKYSSLVYNIARQSTHSETDADDITQEVFIKVWRSVSSFRGESSLSTWIARIAMNTCMDFARKRKRKPTVSLTTFTDPLEQPENSKELDITDTSTSSNPEAAIEKAETTAVVRQAIEDLSEDQRAPLILRDIEGYTYTEISEILNLELGTVKSRINRARQNIKQFLTSRNIYN
jgi:RNA polymerase sigma factor, sigma-70 family